MGVFLADAGDGLKEGGVCFGDCGGDFVCGVLGKNGEGQFGADTGDRDEVFEELQIWLVTEAVEIKGFFFDVGVDEESREL